MAAMVYASPAMVVVVVMVVGMWVGTGEAATDCSGALASVMGCSTFLTNPSSTPDEKGCCNPLQMVLSTPSSFQCICAQATGTDNPLLKNALLLPKACKLDINVSAANCTTPGTTTPAAPKSSTPTTPTGTMSPAGSGSVGALPYSPLIVVALLYSIASLFLY